MLDLLPAKHGSVLRLLTLALSEDYDWLANSLEHVTVSPVTRLKWEQEQRRKQELEQEKEQRNSEQTTASYPSSEASLRSLSSPLSLSSPRSLSSPIPSHCSSPLHSSEFSLSSSCSSRSKRPLEQEELEEAMIMFVQSNPRVMKRWTLLAHQLGLTHRFGDGRCGNWLDLLSMQGGGDQSKG